MNYCAVVLLINFGTLCVVTAKEIPANTGGEVTLGDGDVFNLEKHGPFWEKLSGSRSENGHRSFHSEPEINRNDDQEEHQKLSLKQFLETYAKKHNKKPESNDDDIAQNPKPENDGPGSKDKSKSTWKLMDLQRHKHPFDDRKGWVSLDPVPWSVSKISKWQSKYKPSSERPWDEQGPISSHRPYIHDDDLEFTRPVSITPPSPYLYHRPTESSDRYDTYYDHGERPRPTTQSSIYPRPTAYFGHKVHLEANFPSNSYSNTGKPYSYHKDKDCHNPNHPYDEIITDGLPSNFPQPNPYDAFKRRGSEIEIHSEKHPFNGEGEWVLLSTTKGYKPPRSRQRSLQIGSSSEPTQEIRASRGVRLTVLPPLKGSNVNMTTSHGGLLQVESTFESVDQAKQNFDTKQKILKIKAKGKRRKPAKKNSNKAALGSSEGGQILPQFGDPSAVMAAVGAGLIPATMAMMVPVAMGAG